MHGGDAAGQSSGPPVVCEPHPADTRLAAVPGEGAGWSVCNICLSLSHVCADILCVCPQVKYTKIYLRDTTLIPPFPMLLFGGDIDIQHRERLITLDGWIHFQVRGWGLLALCRPTKWIFFFIESMMLTFVTNSQRIGSSILYLNVLF